MQDGVKLERKTKDELKQIAQGLGIEKISALKKDEIIALIREKREQIANEEKQKVQPKKRERPADAVEVKGVLDVMTDGFGFLRMENYMSGKNDIYVSPTQIRRFNLKTGDEIVGDCRPSQDEDKFSPLLFVKTINGDPLEIALKRRPFERLTPIYPKEKIVPVESESDYNHIVNQCAAILHSSLDLYSQKWPNRTAISVTGGKDSLTTLACANGLYEKFKYFSYDSCPQERIDALAAKQVCESLHLPHSFYEIEGEAQLEGYEQFNMLLEYNLGCTGPVKLNNVNKRIFFSNCSDFDIEVKSWVDEIGRARYHKRFAKRKLPQKMRARYCTCLYKIFITNRRLLRETDQVFKKYITKYYDSDVLNKIPWYDLFYWEFSFGAGDAFFLRAEHRMSYDIAIPFNNRRLVDLMLHVPLSYRIEDRIQKDIIRMRNDQIEKTGVSVVDANYTTLRTLFERVYLEINSRLPF